MKEKIYKIKIFTKNKQVTYAGYLYKVDHVVIAEGKLFVILQGLGERIPADKISCEPSIIILP